MGRPRKKPPAFTPPPDPGPPRPPVQPPDWPTLYPVEGPEIDATTFGQLTTKWQRWKLIREGKLKAVYVGRKVFLTDRSIAEFLLSGGSK